MVKMKERNNQLKAAIGNMAPVKRIIESNNIPSEDTTNKQGYAAYSLDDELKLISMLNTLKLEPQCYRSESQTMRELSELIEKLALNDPYFVAQCIVYSRCLGEGMRSINHLAATLLAPFIAGKDFAKRFYGPFNKKTKSGGCIYRPDDMSEIKDIFDVLNPNVSALTNAMKKGFKSVIESLDTYQIAKYKKSVMDIANLCHPDSKLSNAVINVNGEEMKTIDALMKGISISADTWEVTQSEAGQEIAKAVKEGRIDKKEAKQILDEAKSLNWKELLHDNKLGILAALRNIRNILNTNPDAETINMLCDLISNPNALRNGKIMPYQIDLAFTTINDVNNSEYSNTIKNALLKGYELSIPNLKETLTGKTLVMVDCSGSMHVRCTTKNGKHARSACQQAGLIAATIAKAVNADIIRFGTHAEFFNTNSYMNTNVFELGTYISYSNMGCTSIASAFDLIKRYKKSYDRIIILSDNECNYGVVSKSYKEYIRSVCSPYIYAVDLAAYGTTPVKGDKVNYYYGYGYRFFDDISSKEFNPNMHIDKIRKIII